MKEYKAIKNTLKNLPVHEAPEALWNDIESSIQKNDMFEKLPQHEASEGLWHNIEAQITGTKTRRLWVYRVAAASIVLLIVSSVLFQFLPKKTDLIVADEIIDSRKIDDASNELNTDINVYCNQYPGVCSSDKFTALKKQMDALKNHKKELRDMKSYDSDPEIDFYIKHINLELAMVERKLLAMF